MSTKNNKKQLAIYIHYPFCENKCPYCDFNSYAIKDINHEQYKKAYISELEYMHSILGDRLITTIFFGGGTPSLMPLNTIESILNKITELWEVDSNAEISLEANPTSSEINKFRDFRKLGINRLSIGLQALNDKDLRILGRIHSAKEGMEAVNMASKVFNNYSFDLIYARPNQNLEEWRNELIKAMEINSPHISLYQLTIEQGTKFYDMQVKVPDEEVSAQMYELTLEITDKYGIPMYEISNYAKEGYECKHNLCYWNTGDYIGIGAGAHGRFFMDNKRIATENPKSLRKWLENSVALEELTEQELTEERIIMGLRTKYGVHSKYIKASRNLIEAGLLESSGDYVKVTKKGLLLLDEIIRTFVSTQD